MDAEVGNFLHIFLITLTVTFSAIVKTGIGVGAGIFLLPVLSLVLPPKTALGLGAPAMLVSDVIGLKLYWKQWNVREALLVIPPSVAGVAMGVLFVVLIPSTLFLYWVGIFAILFALHNFVSKFCDAKLKFPEDWSSKKGAGVFFGFFGGFISAISHAGGAVLSVYLLSRKLEKRAFVGLFILFFVITNVCKTFGYLQVGVLTPDLLLFVFILSPFIALGSLIGNSLNRVLSPELFRTIVLSIIFITGLKLLLSG